MRYIKQTKDKGKRGEVERRGWLERCGSCSNLHPS